MIIQRRGFIAGLASMLAAPAIVHAGNLMPVRSIERLVVKTMIIPSHWVIPIGNINWWTAHNGIGPPLVEKPLDGYGKTYQWRLSDSGIKLS